MHLHQCKATSQAQGTLCESTGSTLCNQLLSGQYTLSVHRNHLSEEHECPGDGPWLADLQECKQVLHNTHKELSSRVAKAISRLYSSLRCNTALACHISNSGDRKSTSGLKHRLHLLRNALMFLRGCNITGVQRTMRSFSASSSSVWIQPWSRSILRRLRMCLNCTHHPTDCQHTICSPGMTPCIALHNLYAANAVHAASEHAHACMWMPPLFQGVYKGKVGALRPASMHRKGICMEVSRTGHSTTVAQCP